MNDNPYASPRGQGGESAIPWYAWNVAIAFAALGVAAWSWWLAYRFSTLPPGVLSRMAPYAEWKQIANSIPVTLVGVLNLRIAYKEHRRRKLCNDFSQSS